MEKGADAVRSIDEEQSEFGVGLENMVLTRPCLHGPGNGPDD